MAGVLRDRVPLDVNFYVVVVHKWVEDWTRVVTFLQPQTFTPGKDVAIRKKKKENSTSE